LWELLIPEVIRLPALQGRKWSFVPLSFEALERPATAEERRRFCQVRAAENQIFVIDVCAAGSTAIYKEMGVMRWPDAAPSRDRACERCHPGCFGRTRFAVADLDLEFIEAKKKLVPILASRRPELYGELSVKKM